MNAVFKDSSPLTILFNGDYMTQRTLSHFFGVPLVGQIASNDILQMVENMEGASGISAKDVFINEHPHEDPAQTVLVVGLVFETEEQRNDFKSSEDAKAIYEAFGALAMTQVAPQEVQ